MDKPARPKLQRSFSTIKRQFNWRKSIRPFISSTFLDFQEERAHLQRYVFPQLNSVCHARGTYFAPADLRWGINNEQSQSGSVVTLCLEYVNRCSPFFICLIGERYGTHRPNDAPLLPASLEKLPRNVSWLDRNYLIAASKGHEWILQEAYQYCSVTELEIIQAAILNDSRFCRFYVRDVRHIEDKLLDLPEKVREEKLKMYLAESEETEMRVTDLKHRIINKGLRVQFFRTPEELGQKVLEDWMEIINELYPPLDELLGDVDGEQFREWAAHEAYAETRRRVFVHTPEIQNLYTKLTDHSESWMDPSTPTSAVTEWTVVKGKKKKEDNEPVLKSIMTLIGERGCGKTSLVANWVKEFQSSHPDIKVLAHFVGSSALSTDIRSFLRRVTFELRGEFGGEGPADSSGDSEELSNFHRICEAFVAAIAMGPCVLVLDAVDELGSTMGMGVHQVKEMKWLPARLPPHCKIIITTVRSDLTYKSLNGRRDNETLSIPLFTGTRDKAAVIERHLAMHCKCLDRNHLKTVTSCKLSARPLFLTILASELRVCGTFDNLDKLLEKYVSAPSFRELWKFIISRWTREYGWSTEGRLSASLSNYGHIDPFTGWVAETLRLLACSRHGLSESDILALLRQMGYKGQSEVTSFDFALFRSAAFEALVERPGGLLGFFHQDLRDSVLNCLLGVIPGLNNEPSSSSGVNFLPQMLNGQMQQCHEHLAEYFLRQPSSRRRVEELPYHMDRCSDINGLNKVVTDPDMFLTMQADTSQNISLKLDLIHYCNRLAKENFSITSSLTRMVEDAVRREDNPSKVKSGSKVSFADDVGEMVMRNQRMDWELPGFKRNNVSKSESFNAPSDFTGSCAPPMADLTAMMHPGGPGSIGLGSGGGGNPSNFSSSFNDFESIGSRRTVNKSTLDSGEGHPCPREDLTSRATRTDGESLLDGGSDGGDDREDGASERTKSVEPPPPPPLPPITPGMGFGSQGGRMTAASQLSDGFQGGSLVEEDVVTKQRVEDVGASMESFSYRGSSNGGETETSVDERDGADRITKSAVSFANDDQDILDDLVNSLGDAFEINSGRDEGEVEKKDEAEDDDDEEEDEEDFDEKKIRCRGALLAMQVGKFLAEKSEFDQAEEMLMLAYDRIIDMFPLTNQEQILLVEVQESIGERHLFQLRKEEAERFFNKALDTLDHIIEEEAYDNLKPLLETKGRLLNRLGNMAVHETDITRAEQTLMEASQCMKEANSVAGIATAQYNLGFLKKRLKVHWAAETCFQEALQTRERWYGSSHPCVAEVLDALAGLLCDIDNEHSYDRIKAESYYRRALKIREEALGKDHLLVATTLYHLGKLLKDGGSYQSKREALELMNRALDIRTTKFGADHSLTFYVRNSVKHLRKAIERGDYDRAPVKPPDKRTRDNPRSSLSWRDEDLLSVGQRSGSRSPSRRGSRVSGRSSPRGWQSEDRSPSPAHGKQRAGSAQYQWDKKGGKGKGKDISRDRAQSVPVIKYSGQDMGKTSRVQSGTSQRHGAIADKRSSHGSQGSVINGKANRSTSSSSSSSSGASNKGPSLRAKYLYNGQSDGREDGVSFAEGHTVLGGSESGGSTSKEESRGKRGSKPTSVNGRSYSAVSSSTWMNGPKSAMSECSRTSHQCNIPSVYDSNINGPNSRVTSLLGEAPSPRPRVDAVNEAAWYHGKGRYPKDQRDWYPPRRHQQRPDGHKLPLATPTSQPGK